MILHIDNREPHTLIRQVEADAAMNGIACVRETLERGDFFIDGKKKVMIERKDVRTDFLQSLSSGRLQNQMFNLTHDGMDVSMLAIEGCPSVDDRGYFMKGTVPTGWKWISINGMLTTIQLMGAMVHWVPQNQFSKFIISQCKYWEKEAHGSIQPSFAFPTGTKKGKMDYQKRILMALPGIGEELCNEILTKFTVQEIVSNPECLMQIRHMGKKKVQDIIEVLT